MVGYTEPLLLAALGIGLIWNVSSVLLRTAVRVNLLIKETRLRTKWLNVRNARMRKKEKKRSVSNGGSGDERISCGPGPGILGTTGLTEVTEAR